MRGRLRETLAVLRWRHFMHEAIDRDLDEIEGVVEVARRLRSEKQRLREQRVLVEVN